MPLVSVVMPAFNASSFISEAINSVLNQTEKDFELLICDDGSTDNTLEICNHYTKVDKRIKLFKNNKNLGNLKTTNFLLSKCKGQYIAIQDADDFSIPTRLEICLSEFFKDEKLGLIGTYFMVTNGELNPISCGLLPLSNEEIQKSLEKEVPPFLYASIIVKRELVDAIGGFRPLFNRKGYADLDWICRICELTKVQNLKEIAYLYRQYSVHENSPRNLIAKHGAEIIIEAHKQRLKGQKDFIDTNDMLAIKKFLGSIYLKKGEQSIWSKDYRFAKKVLFKSFLIYPFNLLVIKNLIKVIIKTIFNRR
jgi:glycosyltransferase involved in cell wall biosynthesis